MTDSILVYEGLIRLGFFLGIFAVMASWEGRAPRRAASFSRLQRWPSHLAIAGLNALLLRIVLPSTAVGVALLVERRGFGLLHDLKLPDWGAVPLAVILLDCAIYLQHVTFHAVPSLWRLHRVHHADLDFDVSTGVRFHPLEILLSMGIKLAVIAALGASALGVLIFEIVLNGTSMFNHGNVRIPEHSDRVLRWLIVTPDMHRVHHSIVRCETDSNFGFNLPWWDRLFGTYRAQPMSGHDGLTIGIEQFRDAHELRLDHLLMQPFRGH